MKQITLFLTLALLFCVDSFGQRLTLSDLTNLCNKKNWEDVNQTLLAKNWTYFDSEKGDTYKYSTITWSFNKDNYSDKAQGWFYLYTYEGFPNKISYSVFNKESYSLIQNSISSAGFKLVNSEIEDNQVASTYSNASYSLIISTEKRKDSDWSDRSTTAYRITLIKKEGIYDEDNGKKTEYYYGDILKAEYTLVNGKINGQLKFYHENGKLKKVGNYLNGEEQGIFVEYDENGNKDAEYVMSQGTKNGVLKVFEDNKLSYSTTFQNDLKNGQHIVYYYNDESGLMNLKLIGEYLNDEKSGTWKLFYVEDAKERLLTVENYSKGIKNGDFQEIKGDSLIVGTYINDKIHGKYKVFRDISKVLFGGVINTDTSKITLSSDGNYYEGSKSGFWKNYDLTSTLISEGQFLNDSETGEWKYYYTNWSDGKNGNMPYSKQLFLSQNYSNGKLNGKSTRYSYLNEENYPCSELDENKNPLDTCKRYVYKKVLETTFYKDDKLNGPFELRDSINDVIAKGAFKNDLKDAEWIHRYSDKDDNDKVYFIFQKGSYIKDKRDGEWVEYYQENKIAKTFNYSNGVLNGEFIEWNQFHKPREKKIFENGDFKELVTYDSLGIKPTNKYEIFDIGSTSYKCRKTEFIDNGYVSQEYWLKKEGDINHNWFELIFALATGKLSDGTTGYVDGAFTFYTDGKPMTIGQMLKEERVGWWSVYFYDENVKIEQNYFHGKIIGEIYKTLDDKYYSGEFVYIDNEQNKKEIRKIKDGLRNGKTTYLDPLTGKTLKRETYKNGILD